VLFSHKIFFMKLSNDKIEEIIELIILVIKEDTHLRIAINNSQSNNFHTKEELEKTIDEISSIEMKKIFEQKLKNFDSDRKEYLMEKYGKFILSERLVRSTINPSFGLKRKYGVFGKHY